MLIVGFMFSNLCVAKFEREIEFGDIQFVKVFTLVVQFVGVIIYSVYMRENAPEKEIIVFKILDIKDSFIV